jgi:hypothetical protein
MERGQEEGRRRKCDRLVEILPSQIVIYSTKY